MYVAYFLIQMKNVPVYFMNDCLSLAWGDLERRVWNQERRVDFVCPLLHLLEGSHHVDLSDKVEKL